MFDVNDALSLSLFMKTLIHIIFVQYIEHLCTGLRAIFNFNLRGDLWNFFLYMEFFLYIGNIYNALHGKF